LPAGCAEVFCDAEIAIGLGAEEGEDEEGEKGKFFADIGENDADSETVADKDRELGGCFNDAKYACPTCEESALGENEKYTHAPNEMGEDKIPVESKGVEAGGTVIEQGGEE